MTYIYEKPSLDELTHFGVKGMKWGRRKAEGSNSAPSAKAKKPTRKETRQRGVEFWDKKATALITEAMNDPEVLIKTRLQGSSYPTIVTGREFVDYIRNAGAFDLPMTEIYARKEGSGPYILNDAPIGKFNKHAKGR